MSSAQANNWQGQRMVQLGAQYRTVNSAWVLQKKQNTELTEPVYHLAEDKINMFKVDYPTQHWKRIQTTRVLRFW